MLVRKHLVIAAVIGILTIPGRAFAQDEPEKPKTFVERLDAFGKTIFGGILPAKQDVPKPSKTSEDSGLPQRSESPEKGARVVTRGSMLAEDLDEEPVTPRAGSIFSQPKPKSSSDYDPTLSMEEFLPKKPPPPARSQVAEKPKPVRALAARADGGLSQIALRLRRRGQFRLAPEPAAEATVRFARREGEGRFRD